MSRPQSSSAAPASAASSKFGVKTLSDVRPGVDVDCFVLLTKKERLRAKDGKPFYKIDFRDRRREMQTPIWFDSPFFEECDESWQVGDFYKIRATVRETGYGPQLELRRLRQVVEGDREDGFDPDRCRPSSETPPETLANELLAFAKIRLGKSPLLQMIQRIFKEYRGALLETAASRSHHRPYAGGLLEHSLSVAKIAAQLADHFCAANPALKKTLSRELIVAGAILHDIGKIFDTETIGAAPVRTVEGDLIGHAILSRDVVRKFAPLVDLDDATRIKLEHLVLTHSRFADWGAPQPPASLEGMILHYADYADSTFVSSLAILDADDGNGAFTSRRGPFGAPLLRPDAVVAPPPNDENDDAKPRPGKTPRPSNSPSARPASTRNLFEKRNDATSGDLADAPTPPNKD